MEFGDDSGRATPLRPNPPKCPYDAEKGAGWEGEGLGRCAGTPMATPPLGGGAEVGGNAEEEREEEEGEIPAEAEDGAK